MSLSDKIKPHCRQILSIYHHDKPMVLTKDLKKSIQDLKNKLPKELYVTKDYLIHKIIDKIFGPQLSNSHSSKEETIKSKEE